MVRWYDGGDVGILATLDGATKVCSKIGDKLGIAFRFFSEQIEFVLRIEHTSLVSQLVLFPATGIGIHSQIVLISKRN